MSLILSGVFNILQLVGVLFVLQQLTELDVAPLPLLADLAAQSAT
jgi:hypothetical protein